MDRRNWHSSFQRKHIRYFQTFWNGELQQQAHVQFLVKISSGNRISISLILYDYHCLPYSMPTPPGGVCPILWNIYPSQDVLEFFIFKEIRDFSNYTPTTWAGRDWTSSTTNVQIGLPNEVSTSLTWNSLLTLVLELILGLFGNRT